MGAGPTLLLVHGTGASTHSWAGLAPLLADRFTVVAVDLPGHGFSRCMSKPLLSLPAMAHAVAQLLDHLDLQPDVLVGHSAGAAILIRCCLDGALAPQQLISLNGALLPFRGPAGFLFPPLAKLLFHNSLAVRLFARSARDPKRVERLIQGTGSDLDDEGLDYYRRLFASPTHVAATLGMMANWDLYRFARDLPRLAVPLVLMAAERDKAVPASDADRVREMVPQAGVVRLPALGHLAHEEDPQRVAAAIFSAIDARSE